MDEQFRERAEAFEQAYRALVQQYGVELVPQVQARQLGPVIQTEAVLIAQPLPNWQPPETPKIAVQESPNGKPLMTDEEAQRALHPANGQSR